jgi:hypothetical protein
MSGIVLIIWELIHLKQIMEMHHLLIINHFSLALHLLLNLTIHILLMLNMGKTIQFVEMKVTNAIQLSIY